MSAKFSDISVYNGHLMEKEEKLSYGAHMEEKVVEDAHKEEKLSYGAHAEEEEEKLASSAHRECSLTNIVGVNKGFVDIYQADASDQAKAANDAVTAAVTAAAKAAAKAAAAAAEHAAAADKHDKACELATKAVKAAKAAGLSVSGGIQACAKKLSVSLSTAKSLVCGVLTAILWIMTIFGCTLGASLSGKGVIWVFVIFGLMVGGAGTALIWTGIDKLEKKQKDGDFHTIGTFFADPEDETKADIKTVVPTVFFGAGALVFVVLIVVVAVKKGKSKKLDEFPQIFKDLIMNKSAKVTPELD